MTFESLWSARRVRMFGLMFVSTLVACAPAESEDAEAAYPELSERAIALIPTSQETADACADEIGRTYCSESAAAAAEKRCKARPGACTTDTCLVRYSPQRASCTQGATYPSKASCREPVADDCAFYRECLEPAHTCGGEGYALGYGERFCYAFIKDRESFSPAGQKWLVGMRPCLQRALVPILAENTTCDAVRNEAYTSHPSCYTAPGNSICDLPLVDVTALVRIVSTDLLSLSALDQMRQVATTCMNELVSKAFGSEPGQPAPNQSNGEIAARLAYFRDLAAAGASETTLRAFVRERR